MKFDRKKFFDAYKAVFPLNQLQVDGLERLLWGYETYDGWWDSVPQIANSLSQIKLETAHSYHPVVEGYYLGDSKAANFYTGNTERVTRFQRSLRYYPHFGRGDIQLTWAENYRLLGELVRKYFPEIVAEFEARTLQHFDLGKEPAQALDGRISFCIMTIGMHKGMFRPGHTLDRYINANGVDHFNARDIVNGDKNYKDKAGHKIGDIIASNARRFEKILNASLVEGKPKFLFGNEDIGQDPAVELPDNAAVIEPTENADGGAAIDPTDEPASQAQPPTQNAENITNVQTGAGTVPADFKAEDKTIAAPAPSGILGKGWQWMAGLGLIPASGAGLVETVRGFAADGSFNVADVLGSSKAVLIFLWPYLFWVALAFISFWGVKELLKQVSFIVTQWTMARGDMHNVTVVPAPKTSYLPGSWVSAPVEPIPQLQSVVPETSV